MTSPFAAGRGRVAEFDEARGLGVIEAADVGDSLSADGGRLPFHCTAVVDGSRTVPEGAQVRFVVVPGRMGRWEADRVEPLGLP